LYKEELELDNTIKMGKSNIKDIIAFGFDPEKTFIFSDCEYIKYLYPNVLKVQKSITLNQMKGIFGFSESDNIGKFAFPPV
jgi:tryptophanyl-tRNA synthetase